MLPGELRRRTIHIIGPTVVRELAIMIGLDLSEIGLITIDGVQSSLEDTVKPNSRLCFFPYVTGG